MKFEYLKKVAGYPRYERKYVFKEVTLPEIVIQMKGINGKNQKSNLMVIL